MNTYKIDFTWDDEAQVWYATSEDIPGLVLEHESFDRLVEKVTLVAPELLELNCGITGDFSIDCVAHRRENIVAYG